MQVDDADADLRVGSGRLDVRLCQLVQLVRGRHRRVSWRDLLVVAASAPVPLLQWPAA